MDRQIINKRITGIQSEIDKLVRTLCAMENTDLSQYPENYEMLSTDAAIEMLSKDLHPQNALHPISLTEAGIVTLDSEIQESQPFSGNYAPPQQKRRCNDRRGDCSDCYYCYSDCKI